VRIGAVVQQKLHDARVAFADGVMQRRERSHVHLTRQRRVLAQQLTNRCFIAAGAGDNHAGAVGVRVDHGCGPVELMRLSCSPVLEENLFDLCKFEFPSPGQRSCLWFVIGQAVHAACVRGRFHRFGLRHALVGAVHEKVLRKRISTMATRIALY
jgi:hypothetical protein